MDDVRRKLYQAWHHQYLGRSRRGVADAMQDAIDAGMSEQEIHVVMDQAATATSDLRERAYRRAQPR